MRHCQLPHPTLRTRHQYLTNGRAPHSSRPFPLTTLLRLLCRNSFLFSFSFRSLSFPLTGPTTPTTATTTATGRGDSVVGVGRAGGLFVTYGDGDCFFGVDCLGGFDLEGGVVLFYFYFYFFHMERSIL